MKRAPFSHDDVLANHDAKLKAIAAGDLPTVYQRAKASAYQCAEASAGYALRSEFGLSRISWEEFIEQRNNRLRAQAEAMVRAGRCEPHNVASELAKESIFKLSAHQIRTILHLKLA